MDHFKKRILIVEDDEEMRSLLKDFIEEEYEADSVEKGTYAFRKLMADSFALIITDIRVPGGLDILPGLDNC
jgi:DNA-binding response OmpR family regulator